MKWHMGHGTMKVMFDTNVFSNLARYRIDPSKVPRHWQPVATHLQWREIQATKDEETRARIEAVFYERLPETVPTIAVWDVTSWDQSLWEEPGNVYQSVLEEMNGLRKHKNNPIDAAIAETCARGAMALVTNDGTLAVAAASHGIEVFNVED